MKILMRKVKKECAEIEYLQDGMKFYFPFFYGFGVVEIRKKTRL